MVWLALGGGARIIVVAAPDFGERLEMNSAWEIAFQIDAEIRALPVRNTPGVRGVRRKVSQRLRGAETIEVLAVASELRQNYGYRGTAYELIRCHPGALG